MSAMSAWMPRSAAVRLLLVGIRAYQGVRGGRPSPCRYWPTCSVYAAEAIELHGARRGTWLAVRRLSRCHPWGGKGIDLVPDPAVTTPAPMAATAPAPAGARS